MALLGSWVAGYASVGAVGGGGGRESVDPARGRGCSGGDLQGGIGSPRVAPAASASSRGQDGAAASDPGAGGGWGDHGGGAAAVRRIRPREASAHGHQGADL
jgi:hypothetical protein